MANKILFKDFQESSPIIELETENSAKQNIRIYLKQEYLIHDLLSGNKYRKLKYNLLKAKSESFPNLLTFGGAYSNHIAAVAQGGHLFGFKTIGIIRGEEPPIPGFTIKKARELGMKLFFVSRTAYRNKEQVIKDLKVDLSETFILPEGGTNALALEGAAEIVKHTDFKIDLDYWCAACGTGGTAAGIISALNENQQFIGVSVLKGNFMTEAIRLLLADRNIQKANWVINNEYHFGGYAKFNDELINFINDFNKKFEIPLDPIYTGKLLYGIFDLLKQGFFPEGANVMVVHSGGLQGINGFNERNGNLINC